MAKKITGDNEADRKIIEQAEKDWERCQTDCKEIQQEYTKDKKFVFESLQYDDQEDNDPSNPRLTVNKLLQFVLQVANDARQNNPVGKIMPAKDGATEKLAEVRTGIYRAIDRNSNGKAARQHALLDAIGASYGFYRILTDYEDADSFDQVIKFQRIMDGATVTWDSDCEQPDYSDAMCYFIQSTMSKQKFKATYGKESVDFMGGKISTVWGTADKPTVTEYWYIELIDDVLYKMVDDSNKFGAELADLAKKNGIAEIPEEAYAHDEEGERISRPSKRRQVWWCKLAGGKVLEKTKWPGYWIPIIPVLGRETIIDGKRKLTSLSRPAKHSQKMYNYARSSQARRISKSTKSGWIVAEESISPKFMPQWQTSNTKDWGALFYKSHNAKGEALPIPFQSQPQQIDQGLMEEAQVSTQEMKETQGIYESGLGARGNETSGRAILAREKQGDTATYDFNDNLNIAIRFEVMIINDLIPYVYDVPRQIRILGEDDAEEIIAVNQAAQDPAGNEYHHDMNVGKYTVAVATGPSYATKRQETAESMMELIKAMPPEMGVIFSDVAIRSMDFAGAPIAAERAKKFVSKNFPDIVEPDKPKEGEPKPPDPQLIQAHQQMDQMHGIIEQMQQQLKGLSDAKALEKAKLDLEWYKAETGRLSAEADAKAKLQNPAPMVAQIKADADVERAHVDAHAQILTSRIAADAQPSPQGMQPPTQAQDQTGPLDASESMPPLGEPNA